MRRTTPHHLSVRSTIGILAAAAIVLAVAACGSDSPTAAPETPRPGDGVTDQSHTPGDTDQTHPGDQEGELTKQPIVDGARRVIVIARDIEFEPSSIEVKAGEPIALSLMNEGSLLHDFTLAEAGIHLDVNPGEGVTSGLQIDEPGEYEALCTVAGHAEAGMVLTVVVTES